MGPDVVYHSRSIYTPLDFIGDVGGFTDAILYIGTLFMWLITSDRVMSFLTSNVFKRANRENEEVVSTAALKARERLKPNTCKPCLCTKLRRYTAIEKE